MFILNSDRQLWEAVADDIVKMGGTIVKNSEVKYLNTENGKIKNVVCLENGQERRFGEGDILCLLCLLMI